MSYVEEVDFCTKSECGQDEQSNDESPNTTPERFAKKESEDPDDAAVCSSIKSDDIEHKEQKVEESSSTSPEKLTQAVTDDNGILADRTHSCVEVDNDSLGEQQVDISFNDDIEEERVTTTDGYRADNNSERSNSERTVHTSPLSATVKEDDSSKKYIPPLSSGETTSSQYSGHESSVQADPDGNIVDEIRNGSATDEKSPEIGNERQKEEVALKNVGKTASIVKTDSQDSTMQEKMPPVEIKEQFKIKVEHPKIYPRIEQDTEPMQKPLTVDQLRSLYYNSELEHIEEFIDNFLQVKIYMFSF